ncbi:MAG: o-succinylbenzoate synthase [Bacteroidota bacterium]
MTATWHRYPLHFYQPATTSRNTLRIKESWFIRLSHPHQPDVVGIGECGLLKTLSYDDRPGYEAKLQEVCLHVDQYLEQLDLLNQWPSIRAGLEMASLDLKAQGSRELFPSDFTQNEAPIPINGLIWMGDQAHMRSQIGPKLEAGFHTIKLKVGAIDFEKELELIRLIRKDFGPDQITLRLDANGAFSNKDPLEKLKIYSDFHIHSIEQPIRAGHWEEMAALCEASPIPIALDEELIGVVEADQQKRLLSVIRPPYIILKPSFLGGFAASQGWIDLATAQGADWWATSALESNIGLNAIAQWTYTLNNPLPQGLGTGQLFSNNIPSPLEVRHGKLYYRQDGMWGSLP